MSVVVSFWGNDMSAYMLVDRNTHHGSHKECSREPETQAAFHDLLRPSRRKTMATIRSPAWTRWPTG